MTRGQLSRRCLHRGPVLSRRVADRNGAALLDPARGTRLSPEVDRGASGRLRRVRVSTPFHSPVAASTVARALSISPARTSSRRGPSSRRAQSTESLGSPARFRFARASPSSCAKIPIPSPHSAATRVRSQEASAGLSPPVETDDGDRPVPMHGRKDEGGVRQVVGTVRPDSGRLGVRVHRPVDLRDPGGRDDQAKGRRVAPAVFPPLDGVQRRDQRLHVVARATVRSRSRRRRSRAACEPCGRPPGRRRRPDRNGPRRRGRPGRSGEVPAPALQSWSRGGPTMPAAMVANVSSSISTKLPVIRSAS